MIYDPTQLQKDLVRIMNVFGQRVQCGFFTIRKCKLGDFDLIEVFNIPNGPKHGIKIYPPGKTFFQSDEKPVTEIHVNTWLGETILNKIIWIEENLEQGIL